VRNWESTSYLSSFKSSDRFGPLLRQEAFRRGFGTAAKAVVLIDGAHGLANLARLTFPGCTQIVDFYHAMEHAGLVLEALLGKAHAEYQPRLHRWAERLLKNEVAALIAEARQAGAGRPCAPAAEDALHYFATNLSRLQYGTFRAAGYFIGCGVFEAGCKTVIGARSKQSGMFRSEAGAENPFALRCIHSSRSLDAFRQHRLDSHVARNVRPTFAHAA